MSAIAWRGRRHSARNHQVRGVLSRARRSVSRAGRIGPDTLGTPTSPGVTRAAGDTLSDLQRSRVLRAALHGISGPDRRARVEPTRRQHGSGTTAPGFLPVCASCARPRILLVFDEVISGFRARHRGGARLVGVIPDLTCLGKIIGAGCRSARTRPQRSDAARLAGRSRLPGGTLSGNPLAMTAGLWSLSRLTNSLYRQLAELGATLAEGLATRRKPVSRFR